MLLHSHNFKDDNTGYAKMYNNCPSRLIHGKVNLGWNKILGSLIQIGNVSGYTSEAVHAVLSM